MTKLRYRAWALCFLMFAFSVTAGSVELSNFDGSKNAFSKYIGNGKWVVLKIWAHDCHVCNKEAHEYVAFHNKHKDKDAIMLGLSIDGKKNMDKAKDFMRRHKIPYRTFLGEPEIVANYYQNSTGSPWLGTPTFMIFDPSGKLVAESAGAVPIAVIEKFIAESVVSNSVK